MARSFRLRGGECRLSLVPVQARIEVLQRHLMPSLWDIDVIVCNYAIGIERQLNGGSNLGVRLKRCSIFKLTGESTLPLVQRYTTPLRLGACVAPEGELG